jgi:Tfp pilus assembly protein PilX
MKLNDVRTREEGSALIVALAFLMLFALLVPALLGLANTSILATERLAERRATVYAADAAMEAAIQNVRYNLDAGRDPSIPGVQPCPDLTTSVNGVAVTVKCEGQDGSGVVGSGDAPAPAVQSVGTYATGTCRTIVNGKKVEGKNERGIVVRKDNAKYIVVGGMSANTKLCQEGQKSTVTVQQGVIRGNPCVIAYATSALVPPCAAGGSVTDPGYVPYAKVKPAAVSSVPTTCPTASTWNKVVQIPPGTYTGTPLSNLKKVFPAAACKGAVFWFKPGSYYFEGGAVWKVNPADLSASQPSNIVAGAAKGWSTGSGAACSGFPTGWFVCNSKPRPTVPFPGACMLDTDYPDPPGPPSNPLDAGVEFIFGKDAGMSLDKGNIEMCPPPVPRGYGNDPTKDQRISFYEVKNDNDVFTGSKGATGCMIKEPYPGSGTCLFLKTNSKKIAIYGTVYAPRAPVLITKEFSATVLARGVIARTVWIQATPKKSVPVVAAVPPDVHLDRDVVFTAWVGGSLVLTAEVTFHDQGGQVPGDSVDVDEWSHQQ